MRPDRYADAKQYAAFPVDLTSTVQSPVAKECRGASKIRVEDVTTGTTLAVVLADSGGATRTYTVTAGWELEAHIQSIDATTDVDLLTVFW